MERKGGANWVKYYAQQETCAQQCRVKANNLKKKYRKIRDGNKISGNNRQECENNTTALDIGDFSPENQACIGHHV